MAKDKKNKKGKGKNKNQSASGGGSADAQIIRRLDGNIALSKLQFAVMEKKNKKGKKIKCLVIPIKSNYIEEGKDKKTGEPNGAFYLGVRINLKDQEDQFHQHGFISQSVPSEIYKAANPEEQEEMKKTPILGGLKDWEFVAGAATKDNSGNAGGVMDGEDDDLPF